MESYRVNMAMELGPKMSKVPVSYMEPTHKTNNKRRLSVSMSVVYVLQVETRLVCDMVVWAWYMYNRWRQV